MIRSGSKNNSLHYLDIKVLLFFVIIGDFIMTPWFDKSWINRIQYSLDMFHWTSDNAANFRCPICGDSQKNKTKTRGYFYLKKDGWSMKCHNCGRACKFNTFMKLYYPHLYPEYRLERLREGRSLNIVHSPQKTQDITETQVETSWSNYQIPLSLLDQKHPQVQYCISRKIPSKQLDRIYFTENLDELVRLGFGITDKYIRDGKSVIQSTAKIVFLITDGDGEIEGIQARSIGKKEFITLMFDTNFPKIYGLGDNDPNKPTFVFEAAFCSLFIPNALALLGATAPKKLEEFVNKEKVILVFDNECRSQDTVKRIESAIKDGYKIAFWPPGFPHKDLNDYMKDSFNPNLKELMTSLSKETYSGVRALAKLSNWKRVGVKYVGNKKYKKKQGAL